MQTEFRFRLNGDIMPEIFIQRALVDDEPVGECLSEPRFQSPQTVISVVVFCGYLR